MWPENILDLESGYTKGLECGLKDTCILTAVNVDVKIYWWCEKVPKISAHACLPQLCASSPCPPSLHP